MLSAAHRLRASSGFAETIRRGRRAGRPTLTVHLLPSTALPQADPTDADPTDAAPPAQAGLVVSKAVGNAVMRHRVSRQLRHLLRDRVGALPVGTRLVVRAAPAAAGKSSAELAVDLDAALDRLARR